jgi:hypothetical protein
MVRVHRRRWILEPFSTLEPFGGPTAGAEAFDPSSKPWRVRRSTEELGFVRFSCHLSLPELEVLGGFLQYARYCSRSTYQKDFKVFSGFLHTGRQSNLRVESPSKQDVSGQCQINR